jgi:hypothetical protein
MTFITKIQSLAGAHVSGGFQCGVDWGRKRVFIGSSSYIARVGLITGTEEIYAVNNDYGHTVGGQGSFPPVGLDSQGNIYRKSCNSVYFGAITKISGETLDEVATGDYDGSLFGGAGFANVNTSFGQYCVDVGPGGSFAALSNTIVSKETVHIDNQLWSYAGQSFVCAGKAGSNKAFVLGGPSGSSDTQVMTFSSVLLSVLGSTYTDIQTFVPTDIDPAFTGIFPLGLCVDQTDGHLLVLVSGQVALPDDEQCYLMKLNSSSGAIMWQSQLAGGGAIFFGSQQFAQSRIRNQRLGIITPSPMRVTIFDTSDGSEITSFTDGLAGIPSAGFQAYDDTLGAIVGYFDFTETTGSPLRLNSTPSSYTGWFVLYVDDAIGDTDDPIPGTDAVPPYVPDVPIPVVRQLPLYPRPPFHSYEVGADTVSVFPIKFRVMAQTDLHVTVDGVELDQAVFSFTGRTGDIPGSKTGYVELDDAVSNCTVRVWSAPPAERTTDFLDGEFSKTEANTAFETLWVQARAQNLALARELDDPESGAFTLPAGYHGMRQWLRGDCVITRTGSDTIYSGNSSGTALTGIGETSLAELICVKKGIWFVRTKSGSWSLA